jgi:hypothetical protein
VSTLPTRPYTVEVTTGDQPTRLETILASSWYLAWAAAIEQFSGNARIKVHQYYQLMSNGHKVFVVGELDAERMALDGCVPVGEQRSFPSWLDAKAGFGLALSPHQVNLLGLRNATPASHRS